MKKFLTTIVAGIVPTMAAVVIVCIVFLLIIYFQNVAKVVFGIALFIVFCYIAGLIMRKDQ